MPFTSTNQIISKRFGQSPLAKNVNAAMVCDYFNKIIIDIWGDKIKNQAQAMYLKDKVLTVACLSPVISQEFKLNQIKLINKIADKFGQDTVINLRLLT